MKYTLMLISALWMASAGNAAVLPDYPFLFETGTAQIDVAPDLANVEINIAERGDDPAKVFASVNASIAATLDALTRLKVPTADIDTSDIQRAVDYTRVEKNASTKVQYILSRQVKVRIRDLSVWPTLMADLAKVSHIDAMNSDFQSSSRNAIYEKLEEQAARDAQTRAQRSAGYFGRKIGAAMAISRLPFHTVDAIFTGGPSYMPAPYIPPGNSTGNLHVPAQITLSTSVNVLFKLE